VNFSRADLEIDAPENCLVADTGVEIIYFEHETSD
jgi:hypothetical protein